jgi:hypothetical protein
LKLKVAENGGKPTRLRSSSTRQSMYSIKYTKKMDRKKLRGCPQCSYQKCFKLGFEYLNSNMVAVAIC